MKRLKIIASAYACEPNRGSEPGIGWNIVREIARQHEVWVITRANNRHAVEAELTRSPEPNLRPVYYDLPSWARWWKRGTRGLQLYYYLWQIGAYRAARSLHRTEAFDLAHHVTFGRYWNPSFLALLPIPFVWGPVGGGESTPPGFLRELGRRGKAYEALRLAVRWMGEHDPFVRLTARRAALALATTDETAARLRKLGVKNVQGIGNAALNREDVRRLSSMPPAPGQPFRFISAGRLLHWKGFDLGLRAFAHANLPGADYWIIGGGPERERLGRLARTLGISSRVRFWGELPRDQTLERLAECHALVHPSLHDSGGWVCIEAMAAGRPVLCLDLGGPAVLVTGETGFKIPARYPMQAVICLAHSMRGLSTDGARYREMCSQARLRAATLFTWEAKAGELLDAYERLSATALKSAIRPAQPSGVPAVPRSNAARSVPELMK